MNVCRFDLLLFFLGGLVLCFILQQVFVVVGFFSFTAKL